MWCRDLNINVQDCNVVVSTLSHKVLGSNHADGVSMFFLLPFLFLCGWLSVFLWPMWNISRFLFNQDHTYVPFTFEDLVDYLPFFLLAWVTSPDPHGDSTMWRLWCTLCFQKWMHLPPHTFVTQDSVSQPVTHSFCSGCFSAIFLLLANSNVMATFLFFFKCPFTIEVSILWFTSIQAGFDCFCRT